MTDQPNQTNPTPSGPAPSPEDVLDELLRTLNDALQLAGAVIRAERVAEGGRTAAETVAPIDVRLRVAHQIVEAGAPLAERLFDLQKNRRRRGNEASWS